MGLYVFSFTITCQDIALIIHCKAKKKQGQKSSERVLRVGYQELDGEGMFYSINLGQTRFSFLGPQSSLRGAASGLALKFPWILTRQLFFSNSYSMQ